MSPSGKYRLLLAQLQCSPVMACGKQFFAHYIPSKHAVVSVGVYFGLNIWMDFCEIFNQRNYSM